MSKETKHNSGPEVDSQSRRSIEPFRMLNDTIIEFYMNYLMNQTSQYNRNRCHLFNTFFYNKLKISQKKSLTNGDTSFQEMTGRWDKNVKLFDKDFLVMPICDFRHWILVIICYSSRLQNLKPIKKEDIGVKGIEPEPCIMIFDSLGYKHMTKFTEPIRKFLNYRWQYERPNEEPCDFRDRTKFRDVEAKVPKQRNAYDCGVHLLDSFEKFLDLPLDNHLRIKTGDDLTASWSVDTRRKREKIKSLVSKIMDKH